MTGETTLALHPASDKNPAGMVELGFTVAEVEAFWFLAEGRRGSDILIEQALAQMPCPTIAVASKPVSYDRVSVSLMRIPFRMRRPSAAREALGSSGALQQMQSNQRATTEE